MHFIHIIHVTHLITAVTKHEVRMKIKNTTRNSHYHFFIMLQFSNNIPIPLVEGKEAFKLGKFLTLGGHRFWLIWHVCLSAYGNWTSVGKFGYSCVCLCIHTFIGMFVHVCASICSLICLFICVCVFMSVGMFVHLSVHFSLHLSIPY